MRDGARPGRVPDELPGEATPRRPAAVAESANWRANSASSRFRRADVRPGAALAAPLANAFVGDAGQRGGVRVAVKDAAGDGRAAVVAGSGSGGQLQVLDGQSLTRKTSLLPYPTDNLDGIYVG